MYDVVVGFVVEIDEFFEGIGGLVDVGGCDVYVEFF